MGNDMFNDEQLAHAEIVQKETEDALGWWKDRALKAEAALSALSRARETDGAVREAALRDEIAWLQYTTDTSPLARLERVRVLYLALSSPPRPAVLPLEAPECNDGDDCCRYCGRGLQPCGACKPPAPPADAATEAVRYRAELEFLSEWLLKFHGSINFATVVAMRERLRAALSTPAAAATKEK